MVAAWSPGRNALSGASHPTMKLYLAEKPSQGREIAAVLGAITKKEGWMEGDGIIVTWAFGHLLAEAEPDDYNPDYKRWSLGDLPIIPDPWQYKVAKGARKQLSTIRKLLRKASSVVIATDADREGETIGRSILEYCGWSGEIERLWLSALDEQSIRTALATLKKDHETVNLYYAGQARTRADWLIGMNLSRLYTLLAQQQGFDKVVSVGRVQTPTLRIVVERDQMIREFTPVPYFIVSIQLESEGQSFSAEWIPHNDHPDVDDHGRCIGSAYAQRISEALQAFPLITVTDTQQKKKKRPAPLVFALSDLQVLINQQTGMSAADVLKIAQQLYEAKLITYPRTACSYLPESQGEDAQKILQQLGRIHGLEQMAGNADTSLVSRCWNDAKVEKSSHHGMIPTVEIEALTQQSKEAVYVYLAIATRYIVQFYPAYEYLDTTLSLIHISNEQFEAKGRMTIVPGWKSVLGDMGEEKEKPLPDIGAIPVELPVQSINQVPKQTNPPAHYTEGSLLSAMKNAAKFVKNPDLKAMLRETTGIGTEATRADIIKNLLKKHFLTKKNREIRSTDAGRAVITTVTQQISDPAITALWEQSLDDIAHGKQTRDAFLQRQELWIKQLVKHAMKENESATAFKQIATRLPPCPKCGNPLKRISGKHGYFLSCSGYPECQYTAPDIKHSSQKKDSASQQLNNRNQQNHQL